MALVHKRTIPTERQPLDRKISANFSPVQGVACSSQRIPTAVNLGFLDQEPHHLSIQVAPQLHSQAEWTPFQTHYFSENVLAPKMKWSCNLIMF
jgi:hypothetical protein